MTPPKPARAAPTRNAIANVTWMFTPIAETICRSSTPARIVIPVRVLFSQSQSAIPTTTPTASMKRRASE